MFSKSYIPNTVTALNVFSGFISIIYAYQGNFYLASIWIFIAAIFDLSDGIVARLLNTSSEFGVQLDSLADVISFGAAPSFLLYSSYLKNMGIAGIIISSLLLLFGSFRLARFNVQLEEIHKKGDFCGLPIPLSAATVATLVISLTKDNKINHPYDYYVIPLILLLSFLMVSKIRYNAFPRVHRAMFREKPVYLGLIIIALVLVIVTDGQAIFYLFIAIIFFGIFRYLYFLIFHKHSNEVTPKNFT